MTHDYDDIIHLPHYEPRHHPRMSMGARAAQFAPFAALTGYDAAIQETGRLTDRWVDMGESEQAELNRKMELLTSKIAEHPSVTIEYFLSDGHKTGGSYQTLSGQVKRVDATQRIIVLTDGHQIALDTVKDIHVVISTP